MVSENSIPSDKFNKRYIKSYTETLKMLPREMFNLIMEQYAMIMERKSQNYRKSSVLPE